MDEAPLVPPTISKGKFDAAVVAARIITLAEILYIPGFTELTPEQMSRVAYTPFNMQWVSRPVYWMQSGRSAQWLRGVDRDYQANQVALEEGVRAKLRHVVATAAAGDATALDQLDYGVPSTVTGPRKLEELCAADEVAVFESPVPDMAGPFGAIALSGDAAERVQLALARWNDDFLAMVPGFADALRTRLRDVRVSFWREDGVALLYYFEGADGAPLIWVGWDPRFNTGPTPPYWETLPAPVRTFLTDVHPGFTMLDGESYGLAQPSYMSTFAAWAGFPDFPDGIPDWNTEDRIASTQMLWLTTNGGDTAWCTSPELEVGQVAVNFEGDFSVSELGPELDQLMLRPLGL